MWLWFQMCKFQTQHMGIDILSVQVNIILEWKPKDLEKKKKKSYWW